MNANGPPLTEDGERALRVLHASLHDGLQRTYAEFSAAPGWRLRLRRPGQGMRGSLLLIVYLLVLIADSSYSFAQRIADLEEDGDELVLSSLTRRTQFWILFGVRIAITMPAMLLAGYGESFNGTLRRYVELHKSYKKVCARLGESVKEDWPHQTLQALIAQEVFQGTLCMIGTFAINAMAESMLECVLNLMAIHFLTNLDEWAENNLSLNTRGDAAKWLQNPAKTCHARFDAPEDAEKRLRDAPLEYAVESYLQFWDVEIKPVPIRSVP
eukprot:CAMPEP_0206044730 /NCGR_PEP_ID=MMETSP1466-20131121/13713_1 /ASSEMBLY_ACC=CAM_ASM_001126 /TAXON_ID=44452 /ORGANISM="Pavlova gyrans, Strain CCMP608" /LENGTH=269 /DNA_ID=CAMNT_0053419631 /DNA_START=83 /DNA_END=892 /DNA_ORIENTATION=-